ncbi:hypothetical protein Tco_0795026 [Tanacetum coccineum]
MPVVATHARLACITSLSENTGYWQESNPHESPVEQVGASPTKKKKATCNRQKRTIQSDDAPRQTPWTTEEEITLAKESGGSKRLKSSGSSSKFNDQGGRDKARVARENKGSKASGSSTVNEDALARLMVTEMTAQEKEQRENFLEIKMREVECHEREIATQEYRQEQEDMRFYL